MNMKTIIGYLLLALLIIGMTAGIIYIFHLGGFTLGFSILFTLGIYVASALLISLILLISDLISN